MTDLDKLEAEERARNWCETHGFGFVHFCEKTWALDFEDPRFPKGHMHRFGTEMF